MNILGVEEFQKEVPPNIYFLSLNSWNGSRKAPNILKRNKIEKSWGPLDLIGYSNIYNNFVCFYTVLLLGYYLVTDPLEFYS